MSNDTKDPRLGDESRLAEFRRIAREIAADAPTLAQIKINSLIRDHNPLFEGSSKSAGRAGRQSGIHDVELGEIIGVLR